MVIMVSSEEESETKTAKAAEWDVDMEIQLFYAMANHKPVGINKHFQMSRIWEKLSNSVAKEIPSKKIWNHLESLYDVNMLDDTEPIPFPGRAKTYKLGTDSEFRHILKQKLKEPVLGEDSDDGRSPSPKTSTPRSSSRGTASKDSTPRGGRKETAGPGAHPASKTRKESGSSHASTDTPSVKSEKEYDRRRDSRDSNASGPRESTTNRKSLQKDRTPKPKLSSASVWDSPLIDEELSSSRRGRRRANTSTPQAVVPAKRRRT